MIHSHPDAFPSFISTIFRTGIRVSSNMQQSTMFVTPFHGIFVDKCFLGQFFIHLGHISPKKRPTSNQCHHNNHNFHRHDPERIYNRPFFSIILHFTVCRCYHSEGRSKEIFVQKRMEKQKWEMEDMFEKREIQQHQEGRTNVRHLQSSTLIREKQRGFVRSIKMERQRPEEDHTI
jgi:hypothetical protein